MIPRLDLFPALLIRGADVHRGARVLVLDGSNNTPNEVFAFTWNRRDKSPELVLREVWFSIDISRKRSSAYDITLPSGEVLLAGKAGTRPCSCNANLGTVDIMGIVAALLDA